MTSDAVKKPYFTTVEILFLASMIGLDFAYGMVVGRFSPPGRSRSHTGGHDQPVRLKLVARLLVDNSARSIKYELIWGISRFLPGGELRRHARDSQLVPRSHRNHSRLPHGTVQKQLYVSFSSRSDRRHRNHSPSSHKAPVRSAVERRVQIFLGTTLSRISSSTSSPSRLPSLLAGHRTQRVVEAPEGMEDILMLELSHVSLRFSHEDRTLLDVVSLALGKNEWWDSPPLRRRQDPHRPRRVGVIPA